MGMYTGLRGKVILKEDVAKLFKQYGNCEGSWKYVSEYYPSAKLEVFADDQRQWAIPWGASCYMPDDWGDFTELKGNELSFACSVKNYTGTISKFLDALPDIAISWELEELYEEFTEVTFHVFKGE